MNVLLFPQLLDYGDRSRDAFKAHGHEEASALSVLRILEYILRTQASFLAMYNRMSPVSSLPAVMGAFEHALMTPVARGVPACGVSSYGPLRRLRM
jgi:hypothetical protein